MQRDSIHELLQIFDSKLQREIVNTGPPTSTHLGTCNFKLKTCYCLRNGKQIYNFIGIEGTI